jgi:NUMOD3 motif
VGNVVDFPLTGRFDAKRTFRQPPPPSERLEDYYCYLYRSRDGTPIYAGQGYGRRPWRKERRGAEVDALIASGEAVGPEIIASLETQEQAWAEEIHIIALYGRICDGGTLLNKTLGGSGSRGLKMSAEHKAKLCAASHTAESVAKVAAASRGRKHTDEARAKMSGAGLGKKYGHHSEERKAAIRAGVTRAKLVREDAVTVDLPMAA